MPPPRAELLLRSLAVLEGGVKLGAGSRESFPSEPESVAEEEEELGEGKIPEGEAAECGGRALGAVEHGASGVAESREAPPPKGKRGEASGTPPPPRRVSTRSVTRASALGSVDGPLAAEEVEEGGEPSYSREAAELCGSTVLMEGREGLVQRSTCRGHPDRFWVVCAEQKWRPLDPWVATVVRQQPEVSA